MSARTDAHAIEPVLVNAAGRFKSTRPKDRADIITDAATRLFGQRGYHAVSLKDIADAVGVTPSALYHHFPTKQALLVAVLSRMIDRYHASYEEAATTATTPAELLVALVDALIGPQVDQRQYFVVTAAELRHVSKSFIREITEKRHAAVRLWLDPLLALHPALTEDEGNFMLVAVSCIAPSLMYHEPQLSRAHQVELLSKMALAALFVGDYSTSDNARPVRLERAARASDTDDEGIGHHEYSPIRASSRERILDKALVLFRAKGFNGIGIDDIAGAAGITGPAVYRHFENKEAVLVTLLSRASDRLTASVSRALTRARGTRDALEKLIASYLDLGLDDPDLMAVYWTQIHALSDEARAVVARAERSFVKDWATVLVDLRDDVSEAEARTMVYAAIGLMNSCWWWFDTPLTGAAARPLLQSMAANALMNA